MLRDALINWDAEHPQGKRKTTASPAKKEGGTEEHPQKRKKATASPAKKRKKGVVEQPQLDDDSEVEVIDICLPRPSPSPWLPSSPSIILHIQGPCPMAGSSQNPIVLLDDKEEPMAKGGNIPRAVKRKHQEID